MNTTDIAGFEKMLKVQRPLEFIHLKGLVLGSFRIVFYLDEGYVLSDLSKVSANAQLLFQKFKSRNQQLNLMMIDSVFPKMLAEVATTILIRGLQTLRTYVKDGNSLYGEYLMNYKLNQFAHNLLYSNVVQDSPFNGQFDYEKVYYRLNAEKVIEYYSVYEQREISALVFEEAILKIDLKESALKGREVLLKLDIILN